MTKLMTILSMAIISFTAHANVEKIRACQDAGRYADYLGRFTNTDHCFEGDFTPEIIRACTSESRLNNIHFDDCLDYGSTPELIKACGSEYRYNLINFFDCVKTKAPIEVIRECGRAKRYSGASFFKCVDASTTK